MGLSDCECGGFIALGPTASNRCDKCGAGPFGRAKPPTLPQSLRILAIDMEKMASRMDAEGIGETLDHAIELRGAAAIAITWADGIESNKQLKP